MVTNAMYMKNQHLFILYQIVRGNIGLGWCAHYLFEVNKADRFGFWLIYPLAFKLTFNLAYNDCSSLLEKDVRLFNRQ